MLYKSLTLASLTPASLSRLFSSLRKGSILSNISAYFTYDFRDETFRKSIQKNKQTWSFQKSRVEIWHRLKKILTEDTEECFTWDTNRHKISNRLKHYSNHPKMAWKRTLHFPQMFIVVFLMPYSVLTFTILTITTVLHTAKNTLRYVQ